MLSDFHGSLINGRNNWEAWIKEGPMSSTKDNPKCVILKVNFSIIPSSALIIAVSGLIYVHHYTHCFLNEDRIDVYCLQCDFFFV